MATRILTFLEFAVAASTSLTPEQRKDRARKAGRASQADKTPEQRREAMRRVRLAAAVKAVADRAPELTPEQIDKLRAVLGGTAR